VLEDALKKGSEAWLFQFESSCLQRDKRQLFRARGFVNGGFLGRRESVEEWRDGSKNEVIASRAGIERCAGLKLQISVTEITDCLYIFNKQWCTCL